MAYVDWMINRRVTGWARSRHPGGFLAIVSRW
jgi:hypothetical protein